MNTDEAVRLRRAISKLARHFNTSATDEGLTPTQASVLGLVASRGPVSLADLVQYEHINPTMLSRVVGKLDTAGLIVRTQDPDDLRSVSLTATDAGRATHHRIRTQRAATVSRSAESLSASEQRSIVSALPALERLAERID
jgi:DNA-binding MarR family transcriptional regulator